MTTHDSTRRGSPGLVTVPIAVLGVSFVALLGEYGIPGLWVEPIHEDGEHTMLGTILYFDHFVRELPICLFMAASVVVAFGAGRGSQRAAQGAAALVAVALAAAWWRNGMYGVWLDLGQWRARADIVDWGAHWRSHLLHLPFFHGCALLLGGWLGASPQPQRGWWLAWIAVTLAFMPAVDVFTDTRLLAHQAREMATHAWLTLPLAVGLSGFRRRQSRLSIGGALLILLPAAYVLAVLAGRDVLAAAQKQASAIELLSSHHFEHSLDYVFVALLVSAWPRKR